MCKVLYSSSILGCHDLLLKISNILNSDHKFSQHYHKKYYTVLKMLYMYMQVQ